MSSWGHCKPPFGTPINWSHPLAQGLVCCWPFNDQSGTGTGTTARNILSPSRNGTMLQGATSGASWKAPHLSLAAVTDNLSTFGITADAMIKVQPPLTLLWQGVRTAAVVTNDYIFGTIYSNPNVSPFEALIFQHTSSDTLQGQYNIAGVRKSLAFSHTLFDATKRKHQFALALAPTVIDGTNYVIGYYDGVGLAGSAATAATSVNYTATSYFVCEGPSLSELGALYSRVVSGDEQKWLLAEPFDMFEYPQRPRYSPVSSTASNAPLLIGF